MKQKIIFIVLTALIFTGCFERGIFSSQSPAQSSKILITTTLFPIYDFARQIAGDHAEVIMLLPPGVEAHLFEPKPADMVNIYQSDIFIYTGEFMEPWAHDLINGLQNDSIKIVKVSEGIIFDHENNHQQEDVDHFDHGEGIDPHIWLDFDYAQIMVDNIAQALVEVDSSNADIYRQNAKAYNDKLRQLDDQYREGLTKCASRKIIYGGHYVFGYLSKKYDLDYLTAQGFAPDSEATAQNLINLVEQIKEHQIKYVFYEELASPKIAEVLANETGAQLLFLHGAHNLSKEDYANEVTFISLIENNLQNLIIGLNCKNHSACVNYEVADCPDDCFVCPPCPECSSLSCQTSEFCANLGWYNGVH